MARTRPRTAALQVLGASLVLGALPTSASVAQEWQLAQPTARSGVSMAFDLHRNRTILFGGDDNWGTHGDVFEFDGATWQPRPLAVSPSPRTGAALAFDVFRNRAILFGGSDIFTENAETWEYDGTAWTRRTPTASPPARAFSAMAFDWNRQRTVLFGGRTSLQVLPLADTWEYNGSTWQPITTPSSPGGRHGVAAAYDVQRSRTMLFGGVDFTGSPAAGTFEYDGNDWHLVTTASEPPARSYCQLVYDVNRSRTVLFGGRAAGTALLADTWEYDGLAWHQVATTSAPSPRYMLGMAHDLARARILVYGGLRLVAATGYAPIADTWEYDGTDWTRPVVTPPTGQRCAIVYDAARARTVAVGGTLAETWEWDGARWQSMPVNPQARIDAAMAYDSVRGRTILFGGYWVAYAGDTQWYDGTAWHTYPLSSGPQARSSHAMTFAPARGHVILFGGQSSLTLLADTWEFDGAAWAKVGTPASPAARAFHAMTHDLGRDRTVLFGGAAASSPYLADTWEYDGATWIQGTAAFPSGRRNACIAHDAVRGRTLLYGGDTSTGSVDDLWEYDGATWTSIATPTPPSHPGRFAPIAVELQTGRATLYDGYDTWVLSPARTPTSSLYGVGCAGSAGVPLLQAAPASSPRLGSTFTLRLSALPPAGGLALLAFGTDLVRWGSTLLPADLGLGSCRLWIAPAATTLLAQSAGSATFAFAIPPTPALGGFVFAAQAFAFDAAAGNGIGAASNAVVLRVW
jgi:hypothetical protein